MKYRLKTFSWIIVKLTSSSPRYKTIKISNILLEKYFKVKQNYNTADGDTKNKIKASDLHLSIVFGQYVMAILHVGWGTLGS